VFPGCHGPQLPPTGPMLIMPHHDSRHVFDQGDSRLHLSVGLPSLLVTLSLVARIVCRPISPTTSVEHAPRIRKGTHRPGALMSGALCVAVACWSLQFGGSPATNAGSSLHLTSALGTAHIWWSCRLASPISLGWPDTENTPPHRLWRQVTLR